MTWEAYYAPWDVIRDKNILTNLCLIFDKVKVMGLQWGKFYPTNENEIIEFEKNNYERVRLGSPNQMAALNRWYIGLTTKEGLDISFDDLIKIDREILLQYALEWYPFYNYITPLADGENPVIVSIEPKIEPSQHGLYGKGVKRDSLEFVKFSSIRNRELGIEFEMKQACKEGDGILVYDKPLIPHQNISQIKLAELLAPLMAFQCISISFPCNNILVPEEILEARQKLKNELNDFREKMLEYSLDIVESLGEDISMGKLINHVEIKAKKVQLTTNELHKKVKSERSNIYSKMISGYGGFINLSSLIASFVTNQWWLSVLGVGAQSLLTIFDQTRLINTMVRESGLAYLIKLQKQ